jgi:2-polyprenyl-6-methoxyphenol hydroxylase-like FAD-dependent oxidoreductase
MRVTLCEAHPVLPQRVCGMYLCPAGVALLDRLGLRERLGAGARQLRGMVMVAPNLQRLETYFPSGEKVPSYGLALPRPALDEALLAVAREAGVEVRMGERVRELERSAEGWRAGDLEARLLIGADGRKSFTARLLGLALPVRRSRTALHIDRPARHSLPPMGQMHVFAGGTYIGINSIRAETVNFSMVCHPEALRGRPAAQLINQHLERSPYLGEMLAPLPMEARPVATFPTGARVRCAATENAALVGDASGYIDPLTGEGIYGAFWTAEALAESVIAGWSNLPAALARYARIRARQQRLKGALCEGFQQVIRRPWMANGVQRLLSCRPAVADAFIGIIGNSYSPWRGLARMARYTFLS